MASQEGHVEMVSLLLSHKVNVDCAASNGLTGLHLAAQENHVNLAQVLFDHSCTIDAHTKVTLHFLSSS